MNASLQSVRRSLKLPFHYNDVIMGAIVSNITSLTIVYSMVYSGADQKKHDSSASLAFVREIHRGPVNSPHKWPVTRKMFPFDDVIMRFLGNVDKLHVYMTYLNVYMTDKICIWHDDVIKWKHFPRYWPFVRGIHRSSANSSHNGQWRGSLMFSLICALNKRMSKQSGGWWFEMPPR